MLTLAELEKRFMYHPPIGNQTYRYNRLREKAKDYADLIELFCPDSREKSLAMTKLEEAVMWANAAIARNEQPNPEEA